MAQWGGGGGRVGGRTDRVDSGRVGQLQGVRVRAGRGTIWCTEAGVQQLCVCVCVCACGRAGRVTIWCTEAGACQQGVRVRARVCVCVRACVAGDHLEDGG